MKTLLLILLSLTSFFAFALEGAETFQYPDDTHIYTQADHGLHPWNATSVYKTGTFSLTFDDGPHPTRTASMLDVLKKHNIKATFFVLTSLINDGNAYLIKRMLDEGHTVGSHGFTHDNSNDLAQKIWKDKVTKSFVELAHWYKVAGYEMTKFYYRFPYGAYGGRADYHQINALRDLSRELLGDNCINMVFWDVDTADWVPGMTPQEIANNIIVNNEGGTYIDFKQQGSTYIKVPYQIKDPIGGGVVLEHDVQPNTAEAIDLFLTYAKDRHYTIVPLEEIDEFKITNNCHL
jgi:peptidoglycan/xylan/chitin deacetylase (PgdA/CDA1 family)